MEDFNGLFFSKVRQIEDTVSCLKFEMPYVGNEGGNRSELITKKPANTSYSFCL